MTPAQPPETATVATARPETGSQATAAVSAPNTAPEPGHGLGWSFGRWRTIFERLDKDAIARTAAERQERNPSERKDRLVRQVIHETALQTAEVGVIGALPALFPGIGTAVSLVSVVPEEIYLVRRKCAMILEIACLYGFDPRDNERLYEILAIAGSPGKTVEALMTAKDDLRLMSTRAAAAVAGRMVRKDLMGAKAAGRGIVRRLPALGFLLGGAINYVSLRTVGLRALDFYRRKRELVGGQA